jgi:hypothetical protein
VAVRVKPHGNDSSLWKYNYFSSTIDEQIPADMEDKKKQ